jgi:hypothetical protein
MSDTQFKVAKFLGGEQPDNIYHVTLVKEGEKVEMRCDCPNRRRGKGTNDKHGQMVAKWLLQGEPQGVFNETRPFPVPSNYGTDSGDESESGRDSLSSEDDDDDHPYGR